jgi:hypothetical protein
MLLVVLRPAGRETIGGDAEDPADDREDDLEWTRQRAPARASSTRVA